MHVYMYCTSIYAFTCTVNPYMRLHVLYILLCVYMYCTSLYAFTCIIHPHMHVNVPYNLMCVYMYCTSSYAFNYMYCTSTCTFICTVHPHVRLIIGQTGNANVTIRLSSLKIQQRYWVFATNSNFLVLISLPSNGLDLWYFKLRLLDQTELIVWNILRNWVAKIQGLKITVRGKGSIPKGYCCELLIWSCHTSNWNHAISPFKRDSQCSKGWKFSSKKV